MECATKPKQVPTRRLHVPEHVPGCDVPEREGRKGKLRKWITDRCLRKDRTITPFYYSVISVLYITCVCMLYCTSSFSTVYCRFVDKGDSNTIILYELCLSASTVKIRRWGQIWVDKYHNWRVFSDVNSTERLDSSLITVLVICGLLDSTPEYCSRFSERNKGILRIKSAAAPIAF